MGGKQHCIINTKCTVHGTKTGTTVFTTRSSGYLVKNSLWFQMKPRSQLTFAYILHFTGTLGEFSQKWECVLKHDEATISTKTFITSLFLA